MVALVVGHADSVGGSWLVVVMVGTSDGRSRLGSRS